MRINKITYTPAYKNTYMQQNNQPVFKGKSEAVRTIMNCGFLCAPIAIGMWLAKLFKNNPESDSIYLNDGSYFGEVDELI